MAEHICSISAYYYVLYAPVFCHIQTSEFAYMLILRVVRQTAVMPSAEAPLEVPRYFRVLILEQVVNLHTLVQYLKASRKNARFRNSRWLREDCVTTHSVATLGIMTFCVTTVSMTIKIGHTKQNIKVGVQLSPCHYAECHIDGWDNDIKWKHNAKWLNVSQLKASAVYSFWKKFNLNKTCHRLNPGKVLLASGEPIMLNVIILRLYF